MMRCKACNAKLGLYEFISKKSAAVPEQEDLCRNCRIVSRNADTLDVSDYAHEHLTENWPNFKNNVNNA